MLFANVWNAINEVANGGPKSAGDIVNTFYPAAPGATTANAKIGNIIISWNVSTLYTDQFLANATELQIAVFAFDIFSKVFASYNLHVPDTFQHLYDEVVAGQVPPSADTVQQLTLMLIYRFLVSAVYFLVACVFPSGLG